MSERSKVLRVTAGVGIASALLAACGSQTPANESPAPVTSTSHASVMPSAVAKPSWPVGVVVSFGPKQRLSNRNACYMQNVGDPDHTSMTDCSSDPDPLDYRKKDPVKTATSIVRITQCYDNKGTMTLMRIPQPEDISYSDAEQKQVSRLYDAFGAHPVTDSHAHVGSTACQLIFAATTDFREQYRQFGKTIELPY